MDNLDDPLVQAMSLMQHALELIDSAGDAYDVGAHLDLALNRLREHLPASDQTSSPKASLSQIAPAADPALL